MNNYTVTVVCDQRSKISNEKSLEISSSIEEYKYKNIMSLKLNSNRNNNSRTIKKSVGKTQRKNNLHNK